MAQRNAERSAAGGKLGAREDSGQGHGYTRFAAVRRNQGFAFSPDGREVAYITNTSGHPNVWKQSVDGGWAWQLTTLRERAARVVQWAGPNAVVFSADRHGSERHQLYRVPAAGGWPEPLTQDEDVQHILGERSVDPTGRFVAYAANGRDPGTMDLHLLELETGAARPLLADGGNYTPGGWSPDGATVLAVRVKDTMSQDLVAVGVKGGELVEVTGAASDRVHAPGPWAPDGSGLYVITDRDRDNRGLGFLTADTGALRWVETPDWDVELVDLSPDGRFLAWTVNEAGFSRLFIRDLESGARVPLPELPAGVATALRYSPTGDRLALYLDRPRHCVELYTGRLADEGVAFTRLTFSMLGGLAESDMVTPEPVTIPGEDTDIPALLYRPAVADEDNRVPGVLSIHGGPEAQERPTYAYAGLYQYLLHRGIAVVAPNIRGSTGFGRAYQRLIRRDWGGGDLEDLRAVADHLRSLPWVDSRRLAVFGGSYGGFASLSCATRLPDYWSAAVDIVGPTNLVTFLRHVPAHWQRYVADWVGDPDTEAEELLARSPITHAANVRCPLLVIQGANDPRVPKSESDHFVDRVRGLGRAVDYVVFDDEGHGFTKHANELQALQTAADFLTRHLLAP